MTRVENIKTILTAAVPTIEKSMMDYRRAPADYKTEQESIQLRLPWCGPVSVAIETYLREKYAIDSQVVINRLTEAPRGPNFRILTHVAVQADGVMADLTHSQFMNFVGLTPRAAIDRDLTHLYPKSKALVYGYSEARSVANIFADHAFSVDHDGLIPKIETEYGADGTLRGATHDEMQRVYQSIWDPADYKPWPVEERSEATRAAAEHIADSLKNQ